MIPGRDSQHPGFLESFKYAAKGIKSALKLERNIKVMLAFVPVCSVFAYLLKFNYMEWIVLLLCFASVLAAELLNTAIETVVDLVSPEFNVLAGRAKDISAAAVMVLSIFVGIIGIVLFAHALFFR